MKKCDSFVPFLKWVLYLVKFVTVIRCRYLKMERKLKKRKCEQHDTKFMTGIKEEKGNLAVQGSVFVAARKFIFCI